MTDDLSESVAPAISLISKTQVLLDELPPHRRRIAAVVLDDPPRTTDESITGFAPRCETPEASAVRGLDKVTPNPKQEEPHTAQQYSGHTASRWVLPDERAARCA